ncbi:MAG TPA: spore cortex biosynthesis protein YabQ [Syntrophomonadaceae bacterium]|nr:spore cortex biosynthesis protein YabQ [Syntrophomonadaceae bacterium]
MSDLLIQIQAFFLTLVLGILAGFIFHYYQLTIRKAKVGKYPLYIFDFFLWIIMICLVFFCMLWINQGEMRTYVLIALVAGVLIYYRSLSKYLRNLAEVGADFTLNIIKTIFKIIKLPIIKLAPFIKRLITKPPTPPADSDEE